MSEHLMNNKSVHNYNQITCTVRSLGGFFILLLQCLTQNKSNSATVANHIQPD